ncbi:MAG: large subunit ribosomal protein [Blastocatellia bacterium]|jgi:large subunit ribosomal protein L9|nr:large subunit ribosomal protein [Blastocatellia bacterium]
MAHTNVLLREDIDDLGARGEIVKVKAGYARNYLLPRKLAVEATASNVKQIEQERAALLKKEANERSTAEAQAGQLGALRLNFERRVGEHGLLYGSVTSMDIAEALKERGYEIDRRRITLRDAIKETGEYTVPVRLHRDVTVEIPVVVAGAGGAQTTNAGAATEAANPAAEASGPAVEGQEDASSAEEGAAGEASTQSS